MIISPRAEQLFDEALTLAPESRERFVKNACGDDYPLLDEVTSLLTAANESEAYFSNLSAQVGLDVLAAEPDPVTDNRIIDQWRLIRLIGRGGMGSVYIAERADGQFEKRVALKLLPMGLANEQARERFLAERQILARLVHDNIARLLDGGVTDDGTPYFVMDYVDGSRIDAYCEENELSTRQRLGLILDVLRGVQYAHRNLIIHRDIKPGNVLVEDGRARLLDFGIAKVLEPTATDEDVTQMALRPVTPAYASPEMLRGEPVDVTTDVYSVGVIMYQLLTGRLPLSYDGMSLAEAHTHVAKTIPEPVSQYRSDAGSDLDAIAAKALAKLPSERYESIESLAQDIRNYMQNLPVTAKPPSAWYRAGKFVSRNRIGVAFGAFAAIGLTAFALLATYAAIASREQSRLITVERDRAEATKEFLINLFDAAGPNSSSSGPTAREILDVGRARIASDLADQPALQADLLGTVSEVYSVMGLLNEWHSVLLDEQNLRAETNGTQSPEYFDVIIRLSQAEDLVGKYDEAEKHAREALALSRHLDNRASAAAAHSRLGRILHLKGTLEPAGSEYRKSLQLYQAEYGQTHLMVAEQKLHLATLLHHQQHYQQAYDQIIEVIAIRKELLDEEDGYPTDVYLALGKALAKLDRHDEALEVYQRTFDMNERIYGTDNSYNLYIENSMGKIAEDRKDYSKAISHFRETLRLLNVHTPESPNVGLASYNLGRALQKSGRCDLAVPVFYSALGVLEKHVPDHADTGKANCLLGQCLMESGDYLNAESKLLRGIEIVSSKLDKTHESVQQANAIAVRLYEAMGRPTEAAKFQQAPY